MNETHRVLQSHRTIRKFTDEPVDDEVIAQIVSCGMRAATSSNVQATTVIRVRDLDNREKISASAFGQRQIVECAAFLVWCADVRRSGAASSTGGAEPEFGMTEQFIIATVDAALAGQNATIAAESLGLGTCYIGAIRNDPTVTAEVLELPDHVYPVFGMCIGHPDADPDLKPRLPLEGVLLEDRYTHTDYKELIAEYDDTMSEYYATRSAAQKGSNWSEEMSKLIGSERRAHMRSFLDDRGFGMR